MKIYDPLSKHSSCNGDYVYEVSWWWYIQLQGSLQMANIKACLITNKFWWNDPLEAQTAKGVWKWQRKVNLLKKERQTF